MLVYLATFPRCGHALTRSLIQRNFGYLTANLYPASPHPPKFAVRDAPEPEPGFSDGLLWGPFTQVYVDKRSGARRRLLRNAAQNYLTAELRRRLADEPDLLLLKTHELPPEPLFPGEAAIQMVRHPGAALASFARFTASVGRDQPASLGDLLSGRRGPASWSRYHEAWAAAPLPTLRLRYEDTVDDQAQAVAAIGAFLGLEPPSPPIAAPLDEATRSNPRRNPGSGVDGWRSDFAEPELDLLWTVHGVAAERFGYGRDVTLTGALPPQPCALRRLRTA